MKLFALLTFLCTSLLTAGVSQAQLTFNFLNNTGNAAADAGFQMAADFWSSQFNDDITVNVTRNFSPLGGGALGGTLNTSGTYSYTNFRNAIDADKTSLNDVSFFNGLNNGSSFTLYLNGTTTNLGPHTTNHNLVRLSNANAKAIGLLAADQGGEDTDIVFNSNVSWDFDPSDGIGAGQQDFVGVAIHELGHSMGFLSGVDILNSNFGQFSDSQWNGFVNALDFARHSANSIGANADLDWTADNRDKYYSIDGGVTAGGGLIGGTNHWSTGIFGSRGDGRQASHWKDDLLTGIRLGIMDPTANAPGNTNPVTFLDLQALDIIGWDLVSVPEPSSLMVLFGFSAFAFRRRRLA